MGICASTPDKEHKPMAASDENAANAELPTTKKSENSEADTPPQRNMNVSVMDSIINHHAKAHQAGDITDSDAKNPARLKNIFAMPMDMDSDFIAPDHPKTESQRAFIQAALEGNFIFSHLDKSELKILLDSFEMLNVSKDTNIINQGEVGDYFYILEKGKVDFLIDGKYVGNAEPGNSFGELALLYNCPRNATCTSVEDCQLWKVDQNTFRKILASHTIQNDNETKEVLKKVPFLENLEDMYLQKIVDATTTFTFQKGHLLLRKGDPGRTFYIIKRGKVKVTDIEAGGNTYDDIVLGPGDYLGERAIVTEEPRAANATALEETDVLCLTGEDFVKNLGPLSELIMKSNDRKKLQGIPTFSKSDLVSNEYTTLTSFIDDMEAPAGTVVFREDDTTMGAIYIVRSGTISIESRDGSTSVVSKGGFFGEDTLFVRKGGDNPVAKATAVVIEDAVLGVLTGYVIESVISDLSRLAHPSNSNKTKTELDDSVKFSDLKKYRILGVGTFGKVWLVSNSKTKHKDAYALKIQNKRELIQHHQVAGVIREKKVMEKLNHPFIIKLVNAYQDKDTVMMLLKLVQGGELFNVMHQGGRMKLPEKDAQFYAGAILEGLSYMHHRNILYRDLKPENVLIDKDGYTVIVDLGFAKIVKDKSYTLCGTPLYLAPELILNRGHDKACDHWSWGVLIFEMIVGYTPFYDHGIDQIGLFKRIVNGKYKFPRTGRISEASQDLIMRILVTRPTDRLGSLAGAEMDIKNHPWFHGVDFDALVSKQVKAPWRPRIKNALDVSAFDTWDNVDENSNYGSLTSSEQKLFAEFGGNL